MVKARVPYPEYLGIRVPEGTFDAIKRIISKPGEEMRMSDYLRNIITDRIRRDDPGEDTPLAPWDDPDYEG